MSQYNGSVLLELIPFVSEASVDDAFPLLVKNNDINSILKQMKKTSNADKVYASLFVAAVLLQCTIAQQWELR